jgi:N-acetylglucosaminyldiphosphoundecaprenol N-acetyl-beta-D-mannosaminyltransferase
MFNAGPLIRDADRAVDDMGLVGPSARRTLGTATPARTIGSVVIPAYDEAKVIAQRAQTRRLFGLEFVDDVSVDATVERLLGPQASEEREPIVFTPNVDTVVRLGELEPSGVAHRLRNARYILPDGQPIVWASRLLKQPLRSRLAGSDLVPPLWRRIVAEGRTAMVVASCEEVAESLRSEFPSLAVYVPELFDAADPVALADVVHATADVLDSADPEFVFLGISYPKQQLLAFALIDRLRQQGRRVPVFMCIGGAFDMYVGRTPRAPAWVQRAGAEWFFRFLLEPRRLFHRYFVEDVRFLSIVGRELLAARADRRRPRAASIAWRLSLLRGGLLAAETWGRSESGAKEREPRLGLRRRDRHDGSLP